jgi:hypothetical protein
MSGSERGGNNRRPYKHRERYSPNGERGEESARSPANPNAARPAQNDHRNRDDDGRGDSSRGDSSRGDEGRQEKNTAGKRPQGKKKQEKAKAPQRGAAPQKGAVELFRREVPKASGPRLKWTPVKPPAVPLSVPDCPICGKPIKDVAAALSDRASGTPVHFDCILGRITEAEPREPGDVVGYIGAGRFAVLHYQNPQVPSSFRIKKIIEWESKENRAEWRSPIADHYSIT